MSATTADEEPIDSFTAGGLTAVLTDERAAEKGEHPAPGATAFTVELYTEEAWDPDNPRAVADPLRSVTYTAGPGITDPGDAKAALWSLAADASAAVMAEAPTDTTDLDDERVREALREFRSHYGYDDSEEGITAYVECVKTLRAFREAGADPHDLYERLDG